LDLQPFDVGAHALFLTLAGSHAHGTARADSDIDLRGVTRAPLSVRLSLFRSFEQIEFTVAGSSWQQPLWHEVLARLQVHPTAAGALSTKTEAVVFEVAKFLRLCAEANPNALEILFADQRDWVFDTPAWRTIHAARSEFLTRKVQQTYLGYGLSQLKRIRTHRSWLLTPPAAKPTRAAFGLPEQGTFSADDRARLTSLIESSSDTARSLPPDVLATLDAEKRYLGALKHWHAYETWQVERNPARAELERKHGYDTKHAAHLIRLMRMGLEVLLEGELRVRRPDAEELRAIRDGALTYDALIEEATQLEARMKASLETSSLPEDIDRDRIDALAMGVLDLQASD
jgi:predicted nucleotidyltransferase